MQEAGALGLETTLEVYASLGAVRELVPGLVLGKLRLPEASGPQAGKKPQERGGVQAEVVGRFHRPGREGGTIWADVAGPAF